MNYFYIYYRCTSYNRNLMFLRSTSTNTHERINDYEVVDSIAPDDQAWLEWKSLVEDEGWTSDDLSVLTLQQIPSTRIFWHEKGASHEVKLVSELNEAEYEQLEHFCLSVVKRDRRYFLRQFHDLPFTHASVLFDDDRNIVAYAAICPTSHSHKHLFKLAPLYASSADEAFAVIQPLIRQIIDDIPPDDKLWQEFKDAVRAEGWVNGPDDSVLIILPKLAKSVVAQNKTDGSFIGSVVWCENEGLAYIAFYIILPEYRGFGIGSAIWKRALERIPSDCTIGLRSVERMVHRYKSTDTPIEGQQTFHQRIRVTDLLRIAKSHTLATG
ncbi:hypothetical protein COOONC_20649 [Cooperia oncophora]